MKQIKQRESYESDFTGVWSTIYLRTMGLNFR